MTIGRERRGRGGELRVQCKGTFGEPANAPGQSILINNVPATVVGVTPPEFFGVDPAAAPDVYLPLHTQYPLKPLIHTASSRSGTSTRITIGSK